MKPIKLTLLLLVVSLTAGAQNQEIETELRSFLQTGGFTVSQSTTQERDVNQPGAPMKSMCYLWDFTCNESQLPTLQQMADYMTACSNEPLCYFVKTHTPGSTDWHDILIGDDPNQKVELGRSATSHYTIINFLDANDSTKSHRYAYALEWQEAGAPYKLVKVKGKLTKQPVTEKKYKGKVVITYASIPGKGQKAEKQELSIKLNDDDLIAMSQGIAKIKNIEDFIDAFTGIETLYTMNPGLREPLSRVLYALASQGTRFATQPEQYNAYGQRLKSLLDLSELDGEDSSILATLELAIKTITRMNK